MEPIRYGMVGGGAGAFIGAVHRMALALDGTGTLVCGALSSDADRARASGIELGLDADRAYPSWEAMLDGELARPEDERAELIVIVTPNDSHFAIAQAFVDAGFHVVVDKPMVVSSEQAAALVAAVERAGVVCAVSYNYSGYPLVRAARELVASGELGAIRKVFVQYHQGWLATDLAADAAAGGHKQAAWRADPARAGLGGAIADIGTHAEHLVRFVTGLALESVCADLTSFVPGRVLDDDASVLMRFVGGARGVLTASQVCVGEENGLSLRVHGEAGSLWWQQETPNRLEVVRSSGVREIITRDGAHAGALAAAATRLPTGHPEGFIEAFANLYREVGSAIRAHRTGRSIETLCPDVHDGAAGVAFIERVVASARAGGVWV